MGRGGRAKPTGWSIPARRRRARNRADEPDIGSESDIGRRARNRGGEPGTGQTSPEQAGAASCRKEAAPDDREKLDRSEEAVVGLIPPHPVGEVVGRRA